MSDASGWERSVTVRAARGLVGTVARWLESSEIGRGLGTLSDRFETAVRDSVVGGVAATLAAWSRYSWGYRWLTAEPDPEVIVIDLRETYTVGPVVRVLNRIADPLAATWRSSGVAEAVRTVERAPLRALGVVTATAVLVDLALTLVLGDVTWAGTGGSLVVLALAGLAIREGRSAAELAETRPGRLLRAVFEPPPLPDEQNEDDDGRSGGRD